MLVLLEVCTWSLWKAIDIMDNGHYILSQEDANESGRKKSKAFVVDITLSCTNAQ